MVGVCVLSGVVGSSGATLRTSREPRAQVRTLRAPPKWREVWGLVLIAVLVCALTLRSSHNNQEPPVLADSPPPPTPQKTHTHSRPPTWNMSTGICLRGRKMPMASATPRKEMPKE
jgi:hypothetical protein